MPEELGGDLAGLVIWGADMKGARIRDVDLTGTRISHAWMVDVTIDALVQRLVINGVDVTDYVNQHDAWFPVRTMIMPKDAAGIVAAWDELERLWGEAFALAESLPEGTPDRSVNDEFSLVQTIRHLVFAMDKWCNVPILGRTYHSTGLPNTGSLNFGFPGLDLEATPSYEETREVRAERAAPFRSLITGVTADDLTRTVDIAENGPHEVLHCIHTVLEEEFWHLRYARRDLDIIAG